MGFLSIGNVSIEDAQEDDQIIVFRIESTQMLKMSDHVAVNPHSLPSALGLRGLGTPDVLVEFLQEIVVCLEAQVEKTGEVEGLDACLGAYDEVLELLREIIDVGYAIFKGVAEMVVGLKLRLVLTDSLHENRNRFLILIFFQQQISLCCFVLALHHRRVQQSSDICFSLCRSSL